MFNIPPAHRLPCSSHRPQVTLGSLRHLRLILLTEWPSHNDADKDAMHDWHVAALDALHEAGADPAVRFLWAQRALDEDSAAWGPCPEDSWPSARPLGVDAAFGNASCCVQ